MNISIAMCLILIGWTMFEAVVKYSTIYWHHCYILAVNQKLLGVYSLLYEINIIRTWISLIDTKTLALLNSFVCKEIEQSFHRGLSPHWPTYPTKHFTNKELHFRGWEISCNLTIIHKWGSWAISHRTRALKTRATEPQCLHESSATVLKQSHNGLRPRVQVDVGTKLGKVLFDTGLCN